MRNLSLILLLLFISATTFCQSLNNEWIDYSKTYYKFKVGATGLYRISQNTLNAAGLANTPAEQFQLWRNGKEVAIYTSVVSGTHPANGYIEFWGERNDGKPDRDLYKNPANQLYDTYSLQTDTAAYFLTVNPSANNKRFTDALNDVANNTLPPQPYFLDTYKADFKTMLNRGKAVYYGEYVYSSTYDAGEFWSSDEINPGQSIDNTASNLYVASNGPAASLQVCVAGNSILGSGRKVNVSINGATYIDQSLGSFTATVFANNNVPLSAINSNTAAFKVTDINSNSNDRIVVAFIHLTYPRLFNFGGASNFSFTLPASFQGNYLEITNFNKGSQTPVLYDITNNKRYTANTSAAGILKFALQPSATERALVLVSEDASNIYAVNNLTQRNFINFGSSANQGDYIIISNKILFGGSNSVEQYRQYRTSAAGGGFNAKVYEIDELVDQFAFGIKKHPLSIKNFLRYARQTFVVKPKFVFLIGKAVTYDEYRYNEASPFNDQLNLVPTFGWPASDNILASDNYDPIPATPIGRLAAVSGDEVKIYLDKIKLYEQQQASTTETIENKAWMKTVVHVTGANDEYLSNTLSGFLKGYENIIKDTLFGGNVFNFSKTSTGPVTPITNALMDQLFTSGISLLNYFGHSSATALDYNLNDPDTYNNYGKYPLFVVNGCNAGNFYSFDTSRLSIITSLAERFVLAKDRGAIGFVASTHFGVPDFLDAMNTGFYNSFDKKDYNKAVAYSMIDGEKYLLATGYDSITKYLHAEEYILHGDPALKINAQPKPDFVIEEPQVAVSPSFISIADNSFKVKVYFHNIGKATGDSVSILLKRQYPDGSIETIISKKIPSVRFADSLQLDLPVVASRDKGENKFIVTIDDLNEYDELSETNNTVTKTFFIYEDELKPIYPYNFSIVNKTNIKLAASTADPVSPVRQYVMELDTTELFNSSSKVTKTVSSGGGVVEFDAGISFTDSTVYYWRVAPAVGDNNYHWNTSSFVYLANSSFGYNQSHLYQHLKSSADKIYLDSTSRKWNFKNKESLLQIYNAVFPYYDQDADFQILINGTTVTAAACLGHSIIYNVFDPISLKPLYNQKKPSVEGSGTYGGFMGSTTTVCDKQGAAYNFEFSYLDTTSRRQMRDFMDWVPDGYIVTARIILNEPYADVLVDDWKNDAQVYGDGNTLYQRMKSAGFSKIDSFNYPRSWAFAYQKNRPSFNVIQKLSEGVNDRIFISENIFSPDTSGTITSPVFGPAKAWKTIKWRGASLDASPGDNVQIEVKGIDKSGQESLLYVLSSAQQDYDISSVNVADYPYIKLQMKNEDGVHLTPYQLRYWRIFYDPVPEGALAANILYNFKDTLDLGEKIDAAIVFKNVSDVPFSDSIKVKLTISDKNNVATVIPVNALKKIAPGDTAVVRFIVDSKNYSGNNTLYLDVNPGNDQPEQFHLNNFMYKNVYVKSDDFNPLLDVTFDGVHILNNDIVSAHPLINIKLKDDSKYLLLDDTSLVSVQLKYPDGSMRRFGFGTDTLRFIAATPGAAENVAAVDFSPYLTDDGEYQLYVRGKDKTGNPAGFTEYTVTFQVYNKPMISDMFNYPNPFTTSTAFVFTVTGSQVPQNIRIQILTITGKIVREITKEELGPLHIGRNITEYKWDGTDQYGQKLANGVYLYRVITNLNGKSLDKFNIIDSDGNSVNTGKYFNKGYGKMYLMR